MALNLSPGQVGLFYTYTMKFLPNATQAWSVTSGSLPTGLTLNATTGVISGTPTTAVEARFTMTVVSGIPSTTSQEFVIVITVPPRPVDGSGIKSFCVGEGNTGAQQFHFQYHGSWYMMMKTGSNDNLAFYKSTDGGLTWAHVDAANEPPAPTGGSGRLKALVMGNVWDGADTVYICYATAQVISGFTQTSITATMKTFNLATDTWQPSFGGTVTFTGQIIPWMYMAVMTTGVIRMVYCFDEPTRHLNVIDNNGTAFGAPIIVAAAAAQTSVTFQPRSFIDSSAVNVCHVWYKTGNPPTPGHRYIRIDAAGAGSAPFVPPSSDYTQFASGIFSGSALLESSGDSMTMPFVALSVFSASGFGGQPAVYRGTPLSAPVWTKEYVYPANALDLMNAVVYTDYNFLFRALDGRQACVFVGSHNPLEDGDQGFTAYFICYYDPAHPELKWTVREELYNCYANPYPQQNITFAPLDEIPIWGEAKSDGGFWFAFTGDTQQAGPLDSHTVFVLLYPPSTAPPVTSIENVAF